MEIVTLPVETRAQIESIAKRDDVRQSEVDDLFGSIRAREDSGELPKGATADGWQLLDALNASLEAHKGVANLDDTGTGRRSSSRSGFTSGGYDEADLVPIKNRRG